jgi:hypothetical protein
VRLLFLNSDEKVKVNVLVVLVLNSSEMDNGSSLMRKLNNWIVHA